jgi:protein O-GlcNAc transferase
MNRNTPEYLLGEIKAYENVFQFSTALRLAHEGQRLYPQCREFPNHLGRFLLLQGRVPEALRIFQKMLRDQPDDYLLDSNLILYRHYLHESEGENLYAEHLDWAKRHGPNWVKSPSATASEAFANRKIRLGFVSPDFRRHPVAAFIEPVLREMDRQRFEVFCYAARVGEDDTTLRLRSYADHWHFFRETEWSETSERIRRDRIDVLIDLAGHTPHHVLPIFANRCAPWQGTYLGYPNTTGLKTMDFRMVDSLSDPPQMTDAWNMEKLVRLPETAWCFLPPDIPVAAWEPPSIQGGHITFGSFNALCKLSDYTLQLWAKILARIPSATLLVKNYALHDLEGQRVFLKRAMLAGLPEDRLQLLGGLPAALHHQAYRLVDIALDAYPYHGTTTTCESLWMGVPVISLAGRFHVSRVGVSLLNQVNLEDLVAQSGEQYIEKAVLLATDRERLRGIHHGLRGVMANATLTNAEKFTAQFAQTLREMVSVV